MAVRRVRRIIRKFDPWTVLKFAIIFFACMSTIGVLGIVILWKVAENAGVQSNITDLLVEVGFQEIVLDPGKYLRILIFAAVVWTIVATGLFVLMAILYNLISDIVGGIEVTVLEEDPIPVRTLATTDTRRPMGTLAPAPAPAPTPTARDIEVVEPVLPPAPGPAPEPKSNPAPQPAAVSTSASGGRDEPAERAWP